MNKKNDWVLFDSSPAPATHSPATRTENSHSSIKSLFSPLVHNILLYALEYNGEKIEHILSLYVMVVTTFNKKKVQNSDILNFHYRFLLYFSPFHEFWNKWKYFNSILLTTLKNSLLKLYTKSDLKNTVLRKPHLKFLYRLMRFKWNYWLLYWINFNN